MSMYVYVWIIGCKDLFRRISEKILVTIETCLRKRRRKPDCFLFQNMLKSDYCNIWGKDHFRNLTFSMFNWTTHVVAFCCVLSTIV